MMTLHEMVLILFGWGLIGALALIAHGLIEIGRALKHLVDRKIHISLTTGDYSGATFNVKAELSAAAPVAVSIAKDGER